MLPNLVHTLLNMDNQQANNVLENLQQLLIIRNRRHRNQRYRPEWEEIPEFRGWLQPVPGNDLRARFIKCKKKYNS